MNILSIYNYILIIFVRKIISGINISKFKIINKSFCIKKKINDKEYKPACKLIPSNILKALRNSKIHKIVNGIESLFK